MVEALYVIGNGFDRAHGLPSSYLDFQDYCEKNIPSLYDKIERFYFNPNDLWSDFEQNLKNLDADMLIDWCQLGNEGWNTSFKDFNRFVDEVKNEVDDFRLSVITGFQEWIKSLNTDGLEKIVGFQLSNTLFLNFNYTRTLESIYKVPEYCINHIHGVSFDGTERLVFGHNATLSDIEASIHNGNELEEEARDEIVDLMADFIKPTDSIIQNNRDFFKKIENVKYVICLGVSYNDVDMPYFEAIRKAVGDGARWFCSAFSLADKKRLSEFKRKLKIDSIEMVSIRGFVDPRIQSSLDDLTSSKS